jgi:nicotinic acid mononucleotide adenylyltransferase
MQDQTASMSRVLEALTAASHTLAFARRAPTGLHCSSGTLLCLSASFNPLTRAHWGLVEAADRLLGSQEILLLLAVANVDKTMAGLTLAVRLALLERFAQSRPTVSVAATGPGRFIDKLSVIRAAYPAGTRIIFLLGFDTLVRLCDPKYSQDRDAALATLFAGCECVVAGRPPDPPEAVAVLRSTPPLARYQSRIHAVQLPAELAPITATAIRAQLANGEVPDSVPEEIRPLLAAWAVAHRVGG